MNNTKEASGAFVAVLVVNTVVLAVLKLINQIDIDWLYVFSPLWFNLAMIFMFIGIVLFGVCVVITIYGFVVLISMLLATIGITVKQTYKFADIFDKSKYKLKSKKSNKDTEDSHGGNAQS